MGVELGVDSMRENRRNLKKFRCGKKPAISLNLEGCSSSSSLENEGLTAGASGSNTKNPLNPNWP